jgi:hypothetical protein
MIGQSGSRYDLGFGYNNAGASVNLTGSQNYGARINYTGTDDGCSDNQYKQFDTSKVSGPTYGSVGLESGRNYLIGCPIYRTDLAIARNIRVGGGRQLQLRVDAFNAFNQAFVTGRNNSITYTSPTDQTPQNLNTNADGSIVQTRLQPRNAGFGAANAWTTNSINGNYQRFIQFTARFQF